jgi:hypothetical protein
LPNFLALPLFFVESCGCWLTLYQGSGHLVPTSEMKQWRFEIRSKEARIPEDEIMPIVYSDEEKIWPLATLGKDGGIVDGIVN